MCVGGGSRSGGMKEDSDEARERRREVRCGRGSMGVSMEGEGIKHGVLSREVVEWRGEVDNAGEADGVGQEDGEPRQPNLRFHLW